MQDFTNCEASICTIFNLDSSILESCSCIRRNEQTIIDVKLLDSLPACPECGNPITKIKGYVTKTIQHSLLADKKCVGTMSRIRTHLIDTFFIFKTSFVIVRRFIVTMTVNPNCIVKCFDIFKYHLVCHLIINDLFSIQPLSFN